MLHNNLQCHNFIDPDCILQIGPKTNLILVHQTSVGGTYNLGTRRVASCTYTRLPFLFGDGGRLCTCIISRCLRCRLSYKSLDTVIDYCILIITVMLSTLIKWAVNYIYTYLLLPCILSHFQRGQSEHEMLHHL